MTLCDSVMPEPVVSVLLPVFDAGATLEETLASLSAQSLESFEIVAVNDGSRDSSGAILDSWAASDSRVKPFHSRHQGLLPALNVGLELCRAPLVARMDADDICHPQRLEKQVEAFERDEHLSVVGCCVESFPADDVREGFRLYEEWQNSLLSHEDICREIFIESPLAHPSTMFRRDEAIALGGYEDRGWAEDYDLWLRYHGAGKRFGKLPDVLLSWREHQPRLTRIDRRYSIENFLRAKAHYLLRGQLEHRDGVFIWGAGKTGRRFSKHLIRGGCTPAAFIDIDSRKIGGTQRGVPVYAVEELPSQWARYRDPFLLAAVASRGARELIRRELDRLDIREGERFLCVA